MKKILFGLMSLFAVANIHAEDEFVASQNAFTFDFLHALGKPQANICASPYNIASALELAYFGAENATKSEIGSMLHFPLMSDSALADVVKKTDTYLGTSAVNAKAIAVDTSFMPTDYYLQLVKDKLGADAFEVNFSKRPEEACGSINNWASKMTQGRIKNLLQPSDVNGGTKLVLLSSIYIKAAWQLPFEVSLTKDAPFTTLSGAKKQVSMMEQTKNMRLYQNSDFQVVYRDLKQDNDQQARLEVIVALPQNPELLQTVSVDTLKTWDAGAQDAYVQLFLPKCSIRSRISAKNALQSLGMKQAFTTDADFTALSPKNDLMVSDVIHSAFMQLNESGIEAAAATAVTMVTKSALMPKDPPIVVRCDKPFYLFIRDKNKGLVLFAGLVALPEQVEK